LLLKLRHTVQDKYAFAFIDLQGVEGANVEQCFSYVAEEMLVQLADVLPYPPGLSLPKDSKDFLTFLQQFSKRVQAVRVIVTLDEFGALPHDTAVKLAHTIRAVFTSRLVKDEYSRYVFLVAGATDMLELTTGRNSPLKNVTESVYVGDLPLPQVEQLLAAGFRDTLVPVSAELAGSIHGWTGGHPYWTQLLAASLANQSESPTPATIKCTIEDLLQTEDKNLPYILRGLQRGNPALSQIVDSLLKGNSVRFSRSNTHIAELELLGIIKNQSGNCIVRNKIYEEAIPRELATRGASSVAVSNTKGLPTMNNAHALVIGVGSYLNRRYPDLPATVRDAQAIADTLTDPNRCGYVSGNVQVMTGEQATADNIRISLQDLVDKAEERTTVFIYFSGHGGRIQENGEWKSYLCPREADPDDLSGSAISGVEFSDLIADMRANKLLVMLDACHAGGSADVKSAEDAHRWKAGLTEDYYHSLLKGSGRVVIASSKAEQVSYVRDELSLFTHYLREALNGKAAVRGTGFIHVLDVFHFINEAVQKENPEQVPILKLKDLDLNFAVALDRGGQKSASLSAAEAPIVKIRESIVQDPAAGAEELSRYLAARQEFKARQVEVDLKRNELKQIQRELDLIGPNENDKANRNRIVYFLLRVCSELEAER
jgi:hypothetical protein